MFIHIALVTLTVLLIVALVVALVARPKLRRRVFHQLLGVAAVLVIANVVLVVVALTQHAV